MQLTPITLENAFVRLEPLAERHREPLRAAGNDPDLWRFANVNLNNENFDAWMDYRLAETTKGDLTWAVIEKATREAVGSTSFYAFVDLHKRIEAGWTWYAKRVWSGPVNPSCKLLLFAHGFEALGLNRIELKADATNTRSCRAMEKLGLVSEGIHRAHMVRPDGRLRDTAWYSVIRPEWPAMRERLEARLKAFG